MRISYNWLQRYINLKISPNDLAEKLTSIGLEVEAIDYLGKEFDGFIVGVVLNVQKHPNADRLKVCKVKVSEKSDPLQIVCGAPNVEENQKVIVGTVGATVPHNQHDPSGKPFTLTKVSIRGVESSGMICSAKELGLGEDSGGIMILDRNAKIGTPLSEYLGINDVAFEIGITPNRPDCLSHLGIARDLAAVFGIKYTLPKVTLRKNKKTEVKKNISVSVENKVACPRYTARVIQNVKVQESPAWLKNLLIAAGLRPINNIVDITNFVMLEYGQPLHAFDYDKIEQQKIIVRDAKQGESFTTLDNKKHKLNGTELMICDGIKPIAIGGVMGGINSEISNTSKTILLEAAYFFPMSVRKTAKQLSISTDASYRFERGIDPNLTKQASDRATSLIIELAGGEVLDEIIDSYPKKIHPKKIILRVQRVNDILGTKISSQQIKKFLESIEIKTSTGKTKGSFICTVPTFRPDIEQEIDLIEEVARLFGYDNIENKLSSEVVFSKPDKKESQIISIRNWCVANGLNEILTNSLIDNTTASLFGERIVKVKNPLSIELEILRPSLLASMLHTVEYNLNHGTTRIQLFEIGTIFSEANENENTSVQGFSEKNMIGFCFSGEANTLSWHEKQRSSDIFDLKGFIISLLKSIGLDNRDLIYYNASSSLTEMTISIENNNTYIGFIGKCKPEILKKYKIEKDVFYAELNLDEVLKYNKSAKYKEFSKFPTVRRDVAFIVDKDVPVVEIEKSIMQSGGNLVSSIVLFDLFEGKSIGETKKSVAYTISINSFEKTLTDSEIDSILTSIINSVTKTYNATLRSM